MVSYWTRVKLSWSKTTAWNKLLVLLTGVIALSNTCYTHYARKQFESMNEQLKQMQQSGKQTDQLICLYQNQLLELRKQAVDTHIFAKAAKDQAGIAKRASVTTREALTSVQRAFVTFGGTASATRVIEASKISELVFNLPWQNEGVTPTKNAWSQGAMRSSLEAMSVLAVGYAARFSSMPVLIAVARSSPTPSQSDTAARTSASIGERLILYESNEQPKSTSRAIPDTNDGRANRKSLTVLR
jgi:hypothetical protein